MISRYATLSADEPNGQRFDRALEALAEGTSVVVGDLLLSGSADGLACHVETSWHPDNLTEGTARADLSRAEGSLTALLEASERLRQIIGCRPVSYVLVEDYGMGLMELCRLVGNELKWARARA